MTTWESFIESEKKKDFFGDLSSFVASEYEVNEVFPPRGEIYTAFELTPLDKVRCVILGQDPYHDVGQAHGLAFSVRPDVKIPPSLMNIYKELRDELGLYIPDNGYLTKWAEQGVLLLNTVLTVRAHEAASHQKKGWETFTDDAIRLLNEQDRPIVFMLWGTPARSKKKLLSNPHHLVLESAHPSPLSVYRGFYGCGHFKKCNEFLKEHGEKEIDWQIDNVQTSLLPNLL